MELRAVTVYDYKFYKDFLRYTIPRKPKSNRKK